MEGRPWRVSWLWNAHLARAASVWVVLCNLVYSCTPIVVLWFPFDVYEWGTIMRPVRVVELFIGQPSQVMLRPDGPAGWFIGLLCLLALQGRFFGLWYMCSLWGWCMLSYNRFELTSPHQGSNHCWVHTAQVLRCRLGIIFTFAYRIDRYMLGNCMLVVEAPVWNDVMFYLPYLLFIHWYDSSLSFPCTYSYCQYVVLAPFALSVL